MWNKTDNDIQFQIEFEDDMPMENEPRMVLLMNNDAPYNITLKGKESRQVNIEANIYVSDMEDAIEGGEATGVDIIVSSDGKSKHL